MRVTQDLSYQFEVTGLPRLVEPGLKGAIEPQEHEAALAGPGLDPIGCLALRCLRTEVNRVGTVVDGMPSAEMAANTYDFLDVARAAEAFLAGIPATSLYSVMEGFKQAGMQVGDLGLAEELIDARSLFLTPNTTLGCACGRRG
jgi:hypothetical protein